MKITFKDKLEMIMGKRTTFTGSDDFSSKKFSDVVAYIRAGKMGKSVKGNVVRDTDTGNFYTYEYRGALCYKVTIIHSGEFIKSFELWMDTTGAACQAKETMNVMRKRIPDCKVEPTEEVPAAPAVDYSANSLAELVDIFDKKLQQLSKDPSASALTELDSLKQAMVDKINEKPLAERAPFNKAMGNITMYIDAMKMQANMGVNPAQFFGTYLPQINASLAELAALV